MQLAVWTKQTGTGITFDASGGIWLPNGALRSPDAAWLRRERSDALNPSQRETFPPLAPDLVIEPRSSSDPLAHQAKMQEYADNGVPLGWLIDPIEHRVEIDRPGQAPVVLENPASVSGEPELAGFTLDLKAMW